MTVQYMHVYLILEVFLIQFYIIISISYFYLKIAKARRLPG